MLGAGHGGDVSQWAMAPLPCAVEEESAQHCTLASFHPAQRLDEAGKILMVLPSSAMSLSYKTIYRYSKVLVA